MNRLLKFLHLVGLVMFVGGVLAHAVDALAGTALVGVREHLLLVARALTLPGLGTLAASGVLMVWRGRLRPLRSGWLGWHAGLAGVALLVTLALQVPAELRALDAARASMVVEAGGAHLLACAVQLAVALAAATLGVFKPRLGKNQRQP